MIAWIKRISAVHDKDRIRVEYKTNMRQVEDVEQFKESIENLLVVPYETIRYRLSARADVLGWHKPEGFKTPAPCLGFKTRV